MAEQYFAGKPTSRHKEEIPHAVFHGRMFVFTSDAGVFSRGRIDRGTELLAQSLTLRPDAHVLDLGCGYGVLGIVAATLTPNGRVVMTDVNERAADLARQNLTANAIPHAEVRLGAFYEPVAAGTFDAIVSNPPIRAGKAVVLRIVDEAPAHLRPGGSLWLVARTKQGAKSLGEHMRDVFRNCETVTRGSGYRVLLASSPSG